MTDREDIATKRDVVVVIPARGGSKRIKGKNIRPLAGKPLVHHAIEYALKLTTQVVVSTDSDEVAGVVKTRYPDVFMDFMFPHTDVSTVDEVTQWYHHFYAEENSGVTLVVIQPTMIGDVVPTIQENLQMRKDGEWWRISGLRVVSGLFSEWMDLQTHQTLIDIDIMPDFAAAESFLRKQTTIGIYYKAGEGQGWGHEKRARALADALQDYDVRCEPIDLWKTDHRVECDTMILDIGDTTEEQIMIARLYGKVITIEDNGPGARLAHATINPFNNLKYAVLRPEFYNLPEYVVRDKVNNVLLTFGGQNNHNMDDWVFDAMLSQNHGWESWIFSLITRPLPGRMANAMLRADLVICAGGQTSYEAIKVGVPTIVIPALPTEALRPHLIAANGIINLGLAPTKEALWSAVARVMEDKMLREDMSRRMKATRVGDGAIEIRRLVEDLCQR